MKLLMAVLFVAIVILGVWASGAYAHDAQAMKMAAQGDSRRLDWFKSLHAPNGVTGDWCCDNKDAEHISQDQVRQLGQAWYVFLPDVGTWIEVPADRVVKKPSIDGEPYLFRSSIDPLYNAHYALNGSPYGIRCFVPPVPGY